MFSISKEGTEMQFFRFLCVWIGILINAKRLHFHSVKCTVLCFCVIYTEHKTFYAAREMGNGLVFPCRVMNYYETTNIPKTKQAFWCRAQSWVIILLHDKFHYWFWLTFPPRKWHDFKIDPNTAYAWYFVSKNALTYCEQKLF